MLNILATLPLKELHDTQIVGLNQSENIFYYITSEEISKLAIKKMFQRRPRMGLECSELLASERDTVQWSQIENREYLLSSERSERNTINGGNAKLGICYMHICVCG